MSKIYIVGIVASGKTTLAKKLSKEMNIPHYELDCIVHVKTENGSYKRTPEEQVQEIKRIDELGDWIIEGTLRSSCHCLLEMADKIIFLDTPLWLRKCRILTRFIKQQLHIEPCHYKSDFNVLRLMYKWTDDFENNRKQFEELLSTYKYKLTTIASSNAKL
jgi:adenylate kinase family enzyme